MTAERALSAALELAAAAVDVRTTGDLDRAVWPALGALVGSDSLAATGFDGRTLRWPPGAVPGRYRTTLVIGRDGTEAWLAFHRSGRDFSDRDLALLHLVRPHLADALWRAAHDPRARRLTARER